MNTKFWKAIDDADGETCFMVSVFLSALWFGPAYLLVGIVTMMMIPFIVGGVVLGMKVIARRRIKIFEDLEKI